MPDMEKVLKGLECCLSLDSPCGDCPYYSYEYIQELDCERNLQHDAIALLKYQNGLMLALDQSNAVNGFLNAEIERLNGLLKEQQERIETLESLRRIEQEGR